MDRVGTQPDSVRASLRGGPVDTIFIGGISQGWKTPNYAKTVTCDQCGGYGRYEVSMTYMYFSFFFIPLLRQNKKFYVKTPCCDAVYELDQEVGKAPLHDRQVGITQSDLTLAQEGNRRSAHKGGAYKVWKKCIRRGHETGEDFEYCPEYGGRLQERRMVHTLKGQVICSYSY